MELTLISGSSSRSKPPVSCDKSFFVPTSIQDLPEWRLWKEDITPLRDRVMVERLFSIPKIYDELHKMIQIINEELQRCEPNCVASDTSDDVVRPVVCVSISCLKGTQVSPCYVEKLYEVYRHNPPVKDLKVNRDHTHPIFKGTQLSADREYIWQRSKLATKYLHTADKLTNHRMWSSFPVHIVNSIEEGFKKDPYNNKLEIPYSRRGGKYVVNFETGEAYSVHEQAMYRMRCVASDFDELFACNLLTGTTYKPFARKFDASGILFYSAHPVTGEPVFLLGHMTYGSRSWCDFGGMKNLREYARQTAARECYEETLGVLGDSRSLREMLEDYTNNNVFKVVNENMAYISHFLRIPYDDYPSIFQRAIYDAGDNVELEVDEMKWFSLSSLRGTMKILQRLQWAEASPIFKNGETDSLTHCPLRNEFLQTLCMAEKLKFLDYIKHICAQVHHAQRRGPSTSSPITDKSGTDPCTKAEVRAGMESKPEESTCQSDSGTDLCKNLKAEARAGTEVRSEELDEGMMALSIQAVPEGVGQASPKVSEEVGQASPEELPSLSTDRSSVSRSGKKVLLYGMGAGRMIY